MARFEKEVVLTMTELGIMILFITMAVAISVIVVCVIYLDIQKQKQINILRRVQEEQEHIASQFQQATFEMLQEATHQRANDANKNPSVWRY
jgi:tRNA A37 threonylcarbamoyltransferase TsaD